MLNSEEYVFYVLGRVRCDYCEMAKELLEVEGHPFHYELLNNNKILLKLFKEAGYTTVPQVWYDRGHYFEHIGGYEQLKEFIYDNRNTEVL